jgi:hypothetical protein
MKKTVIWVTDGLSLQPPAQDNTMNLLHQYYIWHETVPDNDQEAGCNMQLTRLTVDILLPGPMSVEQIEVQIIEDDTNLKVAYKPPSTYHPVDVLQFVQILLALLLRRLQRSFHTWLVAISRGMQMHWRRSKKSRRRLISW